MDSLAHKTPSYDTKMPLRAVFDKKVFVKFNLIDIINNFKTKYWWNTIKNNQKFIEKSIPAYVF